MRHFFVFLGFCFFLVQGFQVIWASQQENLDPPSSKNPFLTLVRYQSCDDLKDKFIEFCHHQSRRSQNASVKEQWDTRASTPLETLRRYVQDDLDTKKTKKLLLGCCHHKQKLTVLKEKSSFMGVFSKKEEDHQHTDYVTCLSQYADYKDQILSLYPYDVKTLSQDNGFLGNEEGFDLEVKSILPVKSFQDLKSDFMGTYPYVSRMKDFPEGYFEEIYIENEMLAHEGKGYPNELFELILSRLEPGGKFVMDYAGEPLEIITESLNLWPTCRKFLSNNLQYGINTLYQSWYFYVAPGNSSFFAGSKVQEDTQGNRVVFINPRVHDYSGLLNQSITFFNEPYYPQSSMLSMGYRVLLQENRAFLESIWDKQVTKKASLLVRIGFKNPHWQFEALNPRNNQKAARILSAFKSKD